MDDLLDFTVTFFVEPVLDLFGHRHYTGKWRFSALLPIAVLLFFVLMLLMLACGRMFFAVLCGTCTAVSLVLSIVCGHKRSKEFHDELRQKK